MYKEINRKKSKYEMRIVFGYMIIGIAFFSYIPLGTSIGLGAFPLIAIPFLFGGWYVSYNNKQIKKISNDFKKVYVTKELNKIFPNSKYYYDRGFSEYDVISSGLLKKCDRFKSEDLIMGKFEGVSFICSDVEQKEVRSNGKTTTVVTVFKGRFYEFDFPKEFMYNLLLLQPMHFRPFSNFHKIKTESVKFNSEIKIYAQNEEEAFYILTPQMMERILYLNDKYFDKISFSFIDNKLYMAIDSRVDYFDIKAFKNVDASILKDYQEEIKDIKEFINVLQLNEKLFKTI